jgi:hypothetical protein
VLVNHRDHRHNTAQQRCGRWCRRHRRGCRGLVVTGVDEDDGAAGAGTGDGSAGGAGAARRE